MAVEINKVELLKKQRDCLDVRDDMLRWSRSGDFSAISEADLIRMRWYGLYQHKPRESGAFMLRIRLAGGQLSPRQLRVIADLCDRYARGIADITTRQDIQLHWVRLESIDRIFQSLGEAGLTSRFACGDTPRNVVSCPLAGVLSGEPLDATPHIHAVNQLFIEAGKQLSNLPRKFKTAIAACPDNCHQPHIHDVGLYGVRRSDGQAGFGLLVGGGLASAPRFAQSMQVFVRPNQVTDVARAVIELFRDEGYRAKRTHARLKFLLEDIGWEELRRRIERNLGYQLERDPTLLYPPGRHTEHMGVGRQSDGRFYVGVAVPCGRLTARQLSAVADLADRHATGDRRLRMTCGQNLVILDVPEENVQRLSSELTDAGLAPNAHPARGLTISCTGAEFCNLAVTETKMRVAAVLAWIEKHVPMDAPIKIAVSGCPNNCSQASVADIGLSGMQVIDPTRKSDDGQPLKVDGFNLLAGGCLGEHPRLGKVVAARIPADRIHLAIAGLIRQYQRERLAEGETFAAWAGRSDAESLGKTAQEAAMAADAVTLSVSR